MWKLAQPFRRPVLVFLKHFHTTTKNERLASLCDTQEAQTRGTYMCWIISLLCCVSLSVCQFPFSPELLLMLGFIILPVEFPMALFVELPLAFIGALPMAFIEPPMFGMPPLSEFPIGMFMEFPMGIIELLFIELFMEVSIEPLIEFPYCWLRPPEAEDIIGSCVCCIDGIPM